ncbi:hypothetical protein BOX15_Mlig032438g3 [Macrostomum lignano]|uniref:CRIB domain-containing protein n=1 Tax=Macrostomum lignano TaxID=282301 RepID=A0A267DPE1_9PLAT|nr:hypothetical protein BOX15_Mlig032438g3 [Macrostomum lignano]
MSSTKKLDSVRDSIASLFKRRNRGGGKGSSSGDGSSEGGDDGSSGSSKGGRRISTPQNVKRVMHITFNAGSQGFDGIPENWRQYFEAQPAGSNTDQSISSSTATIPATAATGAEATAAEAAPLITMSVIEEEPGEEERAAMATESISEEPLPVSPAEQVPASATVPAAEATAAEAAEPPLQQRAGEGNTDDEDDAGSPPPTPPPRQPRELLSLVYDREAEQFVNLPPHWEERLKRNNLLAPQFHANPQLLSSVFSLMDQELRAMRAEGERVESCLYSSPSANHRLTAGSTEHSPKICPNPAYVFQIEADKSNSSSESDFLVQEQQEELLQRRSLVTVRAVEMPEDIEITQL